MTSTFRKRAGRVALAASAVIAVSAAIAIGVAVSGPPSESGPGVDTHVGHSNIYVVDVASGDLTQPTNHIGEGAREPSWESDGEIAFSAQACDECPSEIAQVGASDPGQATVETPVKHVFQPSAAPDGHRLAVVALGRGIYSVDATAGTAKRLTEGPSDEAPAWSGNGEWIAFQRQIRGTNYDLFAVHAGTGKERRLTNDARQQTNPSWSPDGTRIAFSEQQTNGKWAIFTMNADGTGRKRITPTETSAQEPSWSPDGTRIAFILQGLDRAAVAIIAASGNGTPETLTEETLFPARPTWSPDGERIAFSAIVVPQ
jgi:Tol biopolymer transport system component